MGIVNRRNAVVGWLTLVVAKRVVKKKVRDAVPSVDPETRKPNKSALALLAAGAVGAATFWRRRSGGGDRPDAAD
jgi:MYXO-CTERM domain-containing protein